MQERGPNARAGWSVARVQIVGLLVFITMWLQIAMGITSNRYVTLKQRLCPWTLK